MWVVTQMCALDGSAQKQGLCSDHPVPGPPLRPHSKPGAVSEPLPFSPSSPLFSFPHLLFGPSPGYLRCTLRVPGPFSATKTSSLCGDTKMLRPAPPTCP